MATLDSRTTSAPKTNNVKTLCSRMGAIIRRRNQKRCIEISAPFDLKHMPVCLPGLSQDDLFILRDKAAASQICVAEYMPRSPTDIISRPLTPRKASLAASSTI